MSGAVSGRVELYRWLGIGVGAERARMRFTHHSGENLYCLSLNETPWDFHERVDLAVADVFLSLHPTTTRRLRVLGDWEAGVSDWVFRLKLKYSDAKLPGEFQGASVFRGVSPYLYIGLLEWVPGGEGRWSLTIGAKCRAAFLPNPSETVTDNGLGTTIVQTEENATGASLVFPYPELSLRVSFRI